MSLCQRHFKTMTEFVEKFAYRYASRFALRFLRK